MKVKVSYQTVHLPPPFAYAYTLDINIRAGIANIEFEQEYLNRESIAEEEILEEGFSLDDDYKWSGELGKEWFEHLTHLFSNPKLKQEDDSLNTWIHLNIDDSKAGIVTDVEFWEYELQELIQAIFEQSGKEKKFHVGIKHLTRQHTDNYILIGSFGDRISYVNEKPLDWDAFRTLLSIIFSIEFPSSIETDPTKDGLWIQYDQEEIFYPIKQVKKQQEVLSILKTI